MQITDVVGWDTLRIAEMPSPPSVNILDSPYSSYIRDSTMDIHTYYKRIAYIRGFRACIYVYSEIVENQIDNWVEIFIDEIYQRIRYDYDACCYKFFNVPQERASADDNWNSPMIYDPYISYQEMGESFCDEPPWYPPAGLDRGKLKKETRKLQLELDDKLFEL